MKVLSVRIKTVVLHPFFRIRRVALGALELQNRERLRMRDEMSETQQLIPLIMKHRNGEKWTLDERRKIQKRLRAMAGLSPYLVLFIMPGGLFLLPALAWWLDKRREKRRMQISDLN